MGIVHAVSSRKATNVSLDSDLLKEARALGINISRSAETGLREAVARRRAEIWKEQNRAGIEASNAYLEKHGIPLSSHRKFDDGFAG
ncbi:type II toxin-antitoxin system CcdA family antitoxin [Thalassospira sp.]|uniref:type II toxin-antitoxin system CcdA family antitoxin n=1 Tax=Thalassospira sp. TaxID=1912094 RepID=UPI0027330D10|nr:type II toxin-antitoxin system CcdA family antitoxin [Thalassospira sp.]MDP2699647.1 type II toxin-antitoxin system CcdA family antitoxin [Thalassospira sp.]